MDITGAITLVVVRSKADTIENVQQDTTSALTKTSVSVANDVVQVTTTVSLADDVFVGSKLAALAIITITIQNPAKADARAAGGGQEHAVYVQQCSDALQTGNTALTTIDVFEFDAVVSAGAGMAIDAPTGESVELATTTVAFTRHVDLK